MSNHNKQPNDSDQDKSGRKISRRALIGGAAALAVGGVVVKREAIQDWSERAEQEYANNQAAKAEKKANDEATAVAEYNDGIARVEDLIEQVGLNGELRFVGAKAEKTRDNAIGKDEYDTVQISFATNVDNEGVTASFPWGMVDIKVAIEGEDETVQLDLNKDGLLEKDNRTGLGSEPEVFLPFVTFVTVRVDDESYNNIGVPSSYTAP